MSKQSIHFAVRALLALALVVLVFSAFAGVTLAQGPKPAPPVGATQLPQTADTDKFVTDLAKQLGLTNTAYEAWQLAANSTWDDTFKYYADQMTQAGWNGQGVTQDFQGGKVGAWVNQDTKTALVVFYVASTDATKPTYDLAIFGTVADSATATTPAKPATAPKPAPQPNSKPADKNADWDKIAADVAKSLGFNDYTYEASELTAATMWEDVVKYYDDQMKQAGWSGQGSTQDITGGKVGAWISNETKSGFVIIYLASPDGVKSAYVFAILGK